MILCCLSIILLALFLNPNSVDFSIIINLLPLDGWSSPVVTGQAPPACSSFTLTTMEGKRAAMFGGSTEPGCYSYDLYIVDLHGRRSAVHVVSV